MPYGPRWRTHRKLFNDFISLSTAKDHDVNQVKVVSDLLVNLHRKPEEFKEHIRLYVVYPPAMLTRLTSGAASRLTGSLALSIAYGIRADTLDNEFICMYEEMFEGARKATVPGSFLVDVLPFRAPNPLSLDRGRASADDVLSQSSIYLHGFLGCDSMRSRAKLRRTCTRL